MDIVEQALSRHGLKYSQLNMDEREYIDNWRSSLQNNSLTIDKVREYVAAMRVGVIREITEKTDSPQDWLSLFSFFIPIVGIIRKWYIDQRMIELKARLRNYALLEVLLSTTDRSAKDMDRALAAFASTIKS